MSAVTEVPTTPDRLPPPGSAVRVSDWNSPRRRKEILLPQVVQLALEGHSSEAIFVSCEDGPLLCLIPTTTP